MKFVHSINQALENVLEIGKEVIVFGEDITDPYGGAFKATKGLSTKFPDRVLPTPISEAGIIGMAGGMAIGGLKPVVEIMFGDFLMLGADQILNHLSKYEWMYNNQVKVPVVIRATMGGRRGYGPTHSQSIEPILAAIPGIKIVSPSYYHNPGDLLEHCVLNDSGIKVFSEYKMNYPKTLLDNNNCKEGLSVKTSGEYYPVVHLSNFDFHNPEVLIISHGGNANIIDSLLLDLLFEYELPVQVNMPSLIKPIRLDDILNGLDHAKAVILVEESPVNFGWGNEIIAQMVEHQLLEGKKIIRIGANETPIPSSITLEDKVLPQKNDIIKKLTEAGII